MRVLGVGCLWLDYADGTSLDVDAREGAEVFQDFKAALETMPSVTNVVFNPTWADPDDWSGAEVTHGMSPNRVVPAFTNSWISFDIYVPERVQQRISDGRSCAVEHFHVDLYYDYYMPVTYISFNMQDDDYPDPSLAIVIVRKLLGESLSNKVISGCVGPSPFHCDFIVKEDRAHQGEPHLISTSSRTLGYDDITITLSSLEEPLPLSLSSLSNVFSAFYHLSVMRSGLLRRSAKVMSLATSLLQPPISKGFARVRAYISEGKIISEIKREVTLGRLDQLKLDRFLFEADRDNATGEGTPLSRFFLEYRQLGKTNAWSDIDYLTTFSEERRQKLFANLSSVMSGILGGIIGAVLASTMTYLLTTTSTNKQVKKSAQRPRQELNKAVTPPSRPDPSPATAPDTAP